MRAFAMLSPSVLACRCGQCKSPVASNAAAPHVPSQQKRLADQQLSVETVKGRHHNANGQAVQWATVPSVPNVAAPNVQDAVKALQDKCASTRYVTGSFLKVPWTLGALQAM
jgi:hypothetical protein